MLYLIYLVILFDANETLGFPHVFYNTVGKNGHFFFFYKDWSLLISRFSMETGQYRDVFTCDFFYILIRFTTFWKLFGKIGFYARRKSFSACWEWLITSLRNVYGGVILLQPYNLDRSSFNVLAFFSWM